MPDPVLGQFLRNRNKDFAGGLLIGLPVGILGALGEPEASELLGDSLNGRLGRKCFGVGGGAPNCEFRGFRILGGEGSGKGKEGRE